MEILQTRNPIMLGSQSTDELYKSLVEEATHFNIATGYITNESIVEIQQAVQYRLLSPKGPMRLNLLIGMNYKKDLLSYNIML